MPFRKMEELKATDVEKYYTVYWTCPECGEKVSHEDESSRGNEVLECWSCETQCKIEWEY